MFRLRDLKNGLFQIHSRYNGAFEGSPDHIFRKAQHLGVRSPDLKLAVNELHKLRHDYADFGYTGRLIHTRKNR